MRINVRNFLSLLIAGLLCDTLLFAAVAKNDGGTPNVTSARPVTSLDLTTFTVSPGSNLCLIAILHNTGGSISNVSMTWDNGGTPQTMTAGPFLTNTEEARIFYLVAPHTGKLTLHAAWTTSRPAELAAIAFSGANQSMCIGTTVNPTGSSTAPSTGAITSTADGATVGVTTHNKNIISTSTQTSIYRTTNYAASYAIGGTSNTHTWATGASGPWAVVGVHILAATRPGCIIGGGIIGPGCVGKNLSPPESVPWNSTNTE
jgi:hypothetical protein